VTAVCNLQFQSLNCLNCLIFFSSSPLGNLRTKLEQFTLSQTPFSFSLLLAVENFTVLS
jgi:hypothetical protein